jgi:hypothetical protein
MLDHSSDIRIFVEENQMPIHQMSFDFAAHREQDSRDSTRRERLEQIIVGIAEERNPAQLSRLIAFEIAASLALMQSDAAARNKQLRASARHQIRAARELQRSIVENIGSGEADRVDVDGRQFNFLVGEMFRLFAQAMTDAGLDHDLRAKVTLTAREAVHWRLEDLKVTGF